jgi:dynein heavy chain, axonemal
MMALRTGFYVHFCLQVMGEGGQIPMSQECNPINILTTDAQIAEWNTDGLPADTVSSRRRAIVSRPVNLRLHMAH